MKVDILDMQRLFGQPVRYESPPLQRRYIWSEEKQWGPLWGDVERTAKYFLKHALDNTPTTKLPTHFLGAIVLQQRSIRMTGDLDVRFVVDGQQRLTTLQLLLGAAQEVFEQRDAVGVAKPTILRLWC